MWVPSDGGFLLFSDIPPNSIDEVKQGRPRPVPEAVGLHRRRRVRPRAGQQRSDRRPPGPAGRRRARRSPRLASDWDGGKRTLADNYQDKRLNSPNYSRQVKAPLVHRSRYGLPDCQDDTKRELEFWGVYRWSPTTGQSRS